MRTTRGALIFICILFLMDCYVFEVLTTLSNSVAPGTKIALYVGYWLISVSAIIGFLVFVFTRPDFMPRKVRTYLFATVMGLFLANLLAIVFFLIDDARRLVQWIALKSFSGNSHAGNLAAEAVSRSAFMSWLGLAAGGSLFLSLIYGFGNKYNYQVKRLTIKFPDLPSSFRGLKMVHFSDVHAGSFTKKKAVQKGVEKIMAEKADLIIFSGDLVNDKAIEMKDYLDMFKLVKAPMGVYSTLGNHDYGEYVKWPQDGVSKSENLNNLKQIHHYLGWKLMMNEHVALKRGGEEIGIIGIENWSAKARFPKHGDMAKAYAGAEKYPFKILISHDPSHWEAEVQPHYPDIDLMLSGHTHGMQFGIEIPGFKWSPVQYVYKQWAGLYEKGKQKLYVNRGFGFIGYPGRVGLLPEITVIELE
jgi:predicted MPP superfamily phosphohydrolase